MTWCDRHAAAAVGASCAKSISTESVEHDGDASVETGGGNSAGGGDHTCSADGRGLRGTVPPPPTSAGNWSAGRGGANGGSGPTGAVGGTATRGGDGGGGDAAAGRWLSYDETDDAEDQPGGGWWLHRGDDAPQRGERAGPPGVPSGGENISESSSGKPTSEKGWEGADG